MNNTDKATFITRTLDTLIGDNASYTTHCGNKTKVASYNNCKNPPLVTKELDKVAPPSHSTRHSFKTPQTIEGSSPQN